MTYAFIGYLVVIFLFLAPVNTGLKVTASLNSLHAGGSFKFSVYQFNFSIKNGQEGWELQGREGVQSKLIKKSQKLTKSILPKIKFDKDILASLYIDKVYITLLYGKKDDAYQTSQFCNAANMLTTVFANVFSGRIKEYKSIIRPSFDTDSFHLQLQISLKINLFIIFITLIKIITLKLKKQFVEEKE